MKTREDILKLAHDWAEELKAKHGTRDPWIIAAEMGVNVEEEDECIFGDRRIWSEYREDDKTIALFCSKENDGPSFDMRVAHELFHHLEKELVGGKLLHSEEGANHFAQKLID
ncbi:MAG: hypothetical protein V1843_02740 [bacterium]